MRCWWPWGASPSPKGWGSTCVGVALDERGRVRTDAQFKTNVPGIYAIGDAVAGAMLAHKAMDEGHAVAEIIAGQKPHINYGNIPSVMYTSPEVAWIGKSEDELKAAGIEYKIGKFPFTANGRAKAMLATQGYVKILADVASGRSALYFVRLRIAMQVVSSITMTAAESMDEPAVHAANLIHVRSGAWFFGRLHRQDEAASECTPSACYRCRMPPPPSHADRRNEMPSDVSSCPAC